MRKQTIYKLNQCREILSIIIHDALDCVYIGNGIIIAYRS